MDEEAEVVVLPAAEAEVVLLADVVVDPPASEGERGFGPRMSQPLNAPRITATNANSKKTRCRLFFKRSNSSPVVKNISALR